MISHAALTNNSRGRWSTVTGECSVKEAKLESVLLGQPASDRTRATVLAELQDPTMQQQQQQAAKSFPSIRPNESGPMAQVLNPVDT